MLHNSELSLQLEVRILKMAKAHTISVLNESSLSNVDRWEKNLSFSNMLEICALKVREAKC